MPGGTRYVQGNVIMYEMIQNSTLAPSSFSATSANTVVQVIGVLPGDTVEVQLPSIVTGVCVGTVLAGTNSITIQFMNTTGGSVTPPAASVNNPYVFLVTRYENTSPKNMRKAIQ